jgi:hypothetical protein
LAAARGSTPAAKSDATQPVTAESNRDGSAKPAKQKPADGKKMSVEEILAAARAGSSAKTADSPAPAQEPTKPSSVSQLDPKNMTVEQILAAARGSSSAAPAVKAASSPKPSPAVQVAAEPSPQPIAESAVQVAEAQPTGPLPTDTAGILAFCRQRDG